MLAKVVKALVVAGLVTLGCALVGIVLGTIPVTVAIEVGKFLTKFSGGLGVVAGLWYFFSR